MIERILGPVAALELIRLSRQRRFFALRIAFILVLLGMLSSRMPADGVSHAELANAASQLYERTVTIVVVAIGVLTPAVVAPAIAGEIATGQLAFLLVTRLSTREIVLGKGVARALLVGQVLLGAVPVVALLQLLGGVSWQGVVVGAVGVGLTLAVVTATSLHASIVCPTPASATIAAYFLLGVISCQAFPVLAMAKFTPIIVIGSLTLIALGFVVGSCRTFPSSVREHLGGVHRPATRINWPRRPVSEWAVWWHERSGDRSAWPWLGWAILTMFAVLVSLKIKPGRDADFALTGGVLGTLALGRVAIVAALSFADARNRDMLELLRLTPTDAGEVLLSKWLAAVVAPWRGVVALAGWMLLAMANGAYSWQSFLFVFWLVYACGVSAVGILVSILTRRAATAVAVTLGLMTLVTGEVVLFGSGWSAVRENPVALAVCGASPPVVFVWCLQPTTGGGWVAGEGFGLAVAGGVVAWLTLTVFALNLSLRWLRRQWEPRRPIAMPREKP